MHSETHSAGTDESVPYEAPAVGDAAPASRKNLQICTIP